MIALAIVGTIVGLLGLAYTLFQRHQAAATCDYAKHGGEWVTEVLKAQGVKFVFTLTGGHISPILVACSKTIRVVDVRHEATAVFAADAVGRLSGIPGVAVVTAGPGVTNTITAVKNCQMAQTPLVLLGGAAATVVQGRGALQDIEQIKLFRTVTKWSKSVRRVKDIVPTIEEAFRQARSGLPGPVFVELPIDVLYPFHLVKGFYKGPSGTSLAATAINMYLQWHLCRLFEGSNEQVVSKKIEFERLEPEIEDVNKVVHQLGQAKRPVLLIGAQAVLNVQDVSRVAAAIREVGVPTYLSSMARGLLGKNDPLQMRHGRRNALKEADVVVLMGVPCDFRLDYGNHIRKSCTYISCNLSRTDLYKNRRPDTAVLADPALFLQRLAKYVPHHLDLNWQEWTKKLSNSDKKRNKEIAKSSLEATKDAKINPMLLCLELNRVCNGDTIFVADGGDFVGTASYILEPPRPLSWLDPGPFGTLGVGAGFALGAKLVRPKSNVCILYGDGSVGYSLAEFDTFARFKLPIMALVGNDASWSQIARAQLEFFQNAVATNLVESDYHVAAEGFGGTGYKLSDPSSIRDALVQPHKAATSNKASKPVLVNCIIGKTDFRKGSLSV